jgi:hypothetical protein
MMGAAQTAKASAIKSLLAGEYRVAYVTPEWCLNDHGASILKQVTSTLGLFIQVVLF